MSRKGERGGGGRPIRPAGCGFRAASALNVRNHLAKLLLLDLKAQGAHGRLELTVVNAAGVVSVEQVEGLADLLDLLLRESGLLGLAASGSAAHCCSWGRERRLRVRQRGACAREI